MSRRWRQPKAKPGEDPGPLQAKPVVCPECRQQQPDLDALGPHIEGHRERSIAVYSRKGNLKSVPCAFACGRHFTKGAGAAELRGHELICDGRPHAPPAPRIRPFIAPGERGHVAEGRAKEREKMANESLSCPKCGKGYQRGGSFFETHVASCVGTTGGALPAMGGATRTPAEITKGMRLAALTLQEEGERKIAEGRQIQIMADQFDRMMKGRFQKTR